MLTKSLNAKGQFVLSWQGHLLCSKYNPIAEAQSWVKSVEPQILNKKHIIVLGLGAGYHVFELSKLFPHKKIIVIEIDQDIFDFHQKYNSIDISKVCSIRLGERSLLVKRTAIRKALRESYGVLVHKPSCRFNSVDYGELKSFLLGRSCDSVNSLFSIRDDLVDIVNLKKMSSLSQDKLVSIKDVLRCMPLSNDQKEFKVFRALGELIK